MNTYEDYLITTIKIKHNGVDGLKEISEELENDEIVSFAPSQNENLETPSRNKFNDPVPDFDEYTPMYSTIQNSDEKTRPQTMISHYLTPYSRRYFDEQNCTIDTASKLRFTEAKTDKRLTTLKNYSKDYNTKYQNSNLKTEYTSDSGHQSTVKRTNGKRVTTLSNFKNYNSSRITNATKGKERKKSVRELLKNQKDQKSSEKLKQPNFTMLNSPIVSNRLTRPINDDKAIIDIKNSRKELHQVDQTVIGDKLDHYLYRQELDDLAKEAYKASFRLKDLYNQTHVYDVNDLDLGIENPVQSKNELKHNTTQFTQTGPKKLKQSSNVLKLKHELAQSSKALQKSVTISYDLLNEIRRLENIVCDLVHDKRRLE